MMKQEPPMRSYDSLIERAAELYDFKRKQEAMPAPQPAPVQERAPVVRPASTPWPTPPAASVAPPVDAPVDTPVAAPPAPAAKPVFVAPAADTPVEPINLDLLRDGGFIVPGDTPTRVSEEFRIVKRHLLLSAFGGSNQQAVPDGRCILICSAHPNEGKTFSAVNLALSLANEQDLEVLLVDADIAKPEVLSTLGIGGGMGLMDAIADPAICVDDLIVQTDVPKLSVLPAGRQTHHDTELLASARGKAVIDSLHRGHPHRIVVVDTAPALAASPASALVHLVGQILVIVRADKTSEQDLREAVGIMSSQAQLRLLLNGTTFEGTTRKYGSYYGYGEV